MLYFDHDTSASDDDKIIALRIEHGGAAVDAYWAVIELMHRDESDLEVPEYMLGTQSIPSGYQAGTQSVPTRYRVAFASLAHRLLIDEQTLSEYISTMIDVGLLHIADDADGLPEGVISLRSERAAANIASYQKKAETARRNGRRNASKSQSVPSGYQAGTQSVPSGYPAGTIRKRKRKSKSKSKERVERENARFAQESAHSKQSTEPENPIPTHDDVTAYFGANALKGDPESFFDYYESQGWVKSNGLPVGDWRSLARSWHRREVERAAERSAKGEPDPADAVWRPAQAEDPVEAYERERREYAALYGEDDLAEFDRERGIS